VCANYDEYSICEEGVARRGGCKWNDSGKHPRVEVPGEGGKGSLCEPTSSRLDEEVGRMGG
jgi:hypothetical protein